MAIRGGEHPGPMTQVGGGWGCQLPGRSSYPLNRPFSESLGYPRGWERLTHPCLYFSSGGEVLTYRRMTSSTVFPQRLETWKRALWKDGTGRGKGFLGGMGRARKVAGPFTALWAGVNIKTQETQYSNSDSKNESIFERWCLPCKIISY